MQEYVTEYWQIRKPAVSGDKGVNGIIASQHHLASDIGADVLRSGGNAIDAAIATGLALGTVEPWMSGIGGGGYMTVYLASTDSVRLVEFGMRAPLASLASDYPLADGGTGADTFNWPKVVNDVNVHGPLSVAVPGYIKGISLALRSFGTMDWRDVIEPACELAEWGLPIDWFSSRMIAGLARGLAQYEQTRLIYLADGLPPVADIEGNIKTLKLGHLAETYRRLQQAGPEDYYQGEVGANLIRDLTAAGSKITTRDLVEYEASITEPLSLNYRDASLFVPGNLTAGPSIVQALSFLGSAPQPDQSFPDATCYLDYADALLRTYQHRLENLGEGSGLPTNTTHICTADRQGNVVSLTQTIMSGFGSRIMSPRTGILMNNGMMWFDPRPGGPNSVIGGRRPLSNMCPTIVKQADDSIFAVGACGGRKIFPAVFQLVSCLVDFGMDIDAAVHQARLDVSGTNMVTLMADMDPQIIERLRAHYPQTRIRPNGVSPNFFGLPQIVQRKSDGSFSGGCFIPSPHAKVAVA